MVRTLCGGERSRDERYNKLSVWNDCVLGLLPHSLWAGQGINHNKKEIKVEIKISQLKKSSSNNASNTKGSARARVHTLKCRPLLLGGVICGH